MKQRGFTLIEAVVYLGLFAIMFGGAIIAAYNVLESSGRGQTKVILQEEGQFLISKINWAISGAKSVNASGQTLTVDKWGTGTVNISASSTDLVLGRETAPAQVLNNSNIKISALGFSYDPGSDTDPERVEFKFTLTAKTPNGIDMPQEFSGVSYLRK